MIRHQSGSQLNTALWPEVENESTQELKGKQSEGTNAHPTVKTVEIDVTLIRVKLKDSPETKTGHGKATSHKDQVDQLVGIMLEG
mmetsp:Transcript_9206/g.10009  ORF Transcript_9206/g.10009 Transcript_9206/m.10009 type:complete len:85 (+) Transcript_9206:573-827(+)